ncbi:hypothetical protein WJX72_008939 [[Myrmecia] bisecta]|uniref:Uncharacterized protein n=1 Tax=[Myrmecia] bisecta TaxID=41462 RepID=A0AAW1R9D1_9CHLO
MKIAQRSLRALQGLQRPACLSTRPGPTVSAFSSTGAALAALAQTTQEVKPGPVHEDGQPGNGWFHSHPVQGDAALEHAQDDSPASTSADGPGHSVTPSTAQQGAAHRVVMQQDVNIWEVPLYSNYRQPRCCIDEVLEGNRLAEDRTVVQSTGPHTPKTHKASKVGEWPKAPRGSEAPLEDDLAGGDYTSHRRQSIGGTRLDRRPAAFHCMSQPGRGAGPAGLAWFAPQHSAHQPGAPGARCYRAMSASNDRHPAAAGGFSEASKADRLGEQPAANWSSIAGRVNGGRGHVNGEVQEGPLPFEDYTPTTFVHSYATSHVAKDAFIADYEADDARILQAKRDVASQAHAVHTAAASESARDGAQRTQRAMRHPGSHSSSQNSGSAAGGGHGHVQADVQEEPHILPFENYMANGFTSLSFEDYMYYMPPKGDVQAATSGAEHAAHAEVNDDVIALAEEIAVNPFSGVVLGPADEADPPTYLTIDELKELHLPIPPECDPDAQGESVAAARKAASKPSEPSQGSSPGQDQVEECGCSQPAVPEFHRSSAGLPM